MLIFRLVVRGDPLFCLISSPKKFLRAKIFPFCSRLEDFVWTEIFLKIFILNHSLNWCCLWEIVLQSWPSWMVGKKFGPPWTLYTGDIATVPSPLNKCGKIWNSVPTIRIPLLPDGTKSHTTFSAFYRCNYFC